MSEHPMQPIYSDEHGTLRFKENSIVRHLLDHGGINMNTLAMLDFSQEDREQFAQLIGYSLSGFSELSYVRNVTYETAKRMAETDQTAEQSRIDVLEAKLNSVQETFRKLVPELFQIHPDDLVL